MEVEITPEPEVEEQRAIAAALQQDPPCPRGAWWRAALPDAGEEDAGGYASARPRSTLGASRA
jgi:hypothetical protein